MLRRKPDLREVIPNMFSEGFEKVRLNSGETPQSDPKRHGKMLVARDGVEINWLEGGIGVEDMSQTLDFVNANCRTDIKITDTERGDYALTFDPELRAPVLAGLSRLAFYGTTFDDKRSLR
jgi:hypothetical protein